MSDNVISGNFKNYKNTRALRRKRRVRVMAIVGAVLMVGTIIGSIIYYI